MTCIIVVISYKCTATEQKTRVNKEVNGVFEEINLKENLLEVIIVKVQMLICMRAF